jgi:hypothetical protein
MSKQISTYAELRMEIREALRRQHPEWIKSSGESPLCELYERRFAALLALLTPPENEPPLENSL